MRYTSVETGWRLTFGFKPRVGMKQKFRYTGTRRLSGLGDFEALCSRGTRDRVNPSTGVAADHRALRQLQWP
ncbi:MAG: hypothetical protein CTY20_03370 [Hyphomicrobium sp.]|nr:MAG: hypothetical protein CTY20_03370 [Hyphomicrobium sp.]